MVRMKQNFLVVAWLICMTACLTHNGRAQELANGIVAVVDNSPITFHELSTFTRQDEQFIVERLRDQPELLNKKIVEMRQSAIDLIVDRQVILTASAEAFKIPESIIEEYVNDRIKEKYADRVALIKQLQADGMTMEQLRKKFRDNLLIDQMRIKNVPEPIISPRKVEAFYAAHREDYKVDDEIKMRMIFLNKETNSTELAESARRRANDILSQINGGASFEEMARTYSEGSLREQGGETGWEEISVVNKSLVEPLNKLKPGQHSGVLDTAEGFYILLLEDRHATHYKPISEVRAQIETTLASRETDIRQKEWVSRLKKKTFVSMF